MTILAALGASLVGCPRKMTQEVVKEVPKQCPPVAAPAAEKPSVRELITVALVRSGDGPRAVVATAGYSAVVQNGDAVGSEPAVVKRITPDGVTVALEDGTELLLAVGADLDAKAQPMNGEAQPDQPAQPTETTRELTDLERWRSGVILGVARGYGIPVDVPWALTLALMPHQPPQVAGALRSLGWSPTNGLEGAQLSRIEVRDGTVTVEGFAPNKTVLDSILTRLKSANPIIDTVKVKSQVPENGGLKFNLQLDGPMVSARDIAREGVPARDGAWPAQLKSSLDEAAKPLPKNSALGGVEDDIKALAGRYSLTVSKVQRLPATVEEGYLGMASFDLELAGDLRTLTAFLGALRTEGASGRPVAVDPLVIAAGKAQATIRVPYVTGKVDARTPAPAPPILPALTNDRWRAARSLPLPTLRDPFQK